jgi:uncharacterized damage-inducible protein DinB
MPSTDPIEIMLAHDRWATRNLLDACASLSDEKFHQRFEMGPGSLHDTTTHILGAMAGWTDLLAGRPFQPRLEGSRRSVLELTSLHDQVTDQFAQHARAHPLDGLVTRERDGKSYTFSRAAVITHVLTHGMHHRAQCLNMLRHVGCATLPPSSILQWTMLADPSR